VPPARLPSEAAEKTLTSDVFGVHNQAGARDLRFFERRHSPKHEVLRNLQAGLRLEVSAAKVLADAD
jgi:hypothetical protein